LSQQTLQRCALRDGLLGDQRLRAALNLLKSGHQELYRLVLGLHLRLELGYFRLELLMFLIIDEARFRLQRLVLLHLLNVGLISFFYGRLLDLLQISAADVASAHMLWRHELIVFLREELLEHSVVGHWPAIYAQTKRKDLSLCYFKLSTERLGGQGLSLALVQC